MRWFQGLFNDLEPQTCEELDAAKRSAHFAAGEDLSVVGGKADRMYYVRSGRVKVWRPCRDGSALTLYYLGDGAPLGLLAIVHDAPLVVTMTAATPVDVYYWPASLVQRLLGKDAHFAKNGMRILGGALRLVAERLEDVTSARAEQQIGRALLRLAGENARWDDDGAVTVDVSRQELADMTGATLFTASRTLSDWGRQGLIESSRGRITVKDPHALAALADVDA